MAEYQSLVDRATNVANQPYQPYQGEQVAPLTSQTNAGLGGINQYANAAQPYLGAAGAMTMGASAPVNPMQFQGMGSLAPFMNPYTSSVVDTTQAEMNNQNEQQAQFLNSANISSGAFGGDRAGIGQSILANQQNLAEAPTIAGLNQANFTQAMGDWTGQQSTNLAAQQANAARQMSGAAQLGEIGQSAQQAGLQGAQADIQAGMIPQQEQQAIDTAAQQMYQQGQAYPFTTTGWLGNLIEGTGSLSGGQSQTTSPGPNSIAQGLGAATSGLGLLGSLVGMSDERAKENVEEIGKTYDGQNIYRYNFKGDPRTQIGLIAQEEAYHDPGSVHRIGMGDLLGIDYGRATQGAAERGHYADGGEAEPPPGGVTQGVTQGIQPQQKPQSMSPDQALMFMGDPSARSGMGSFALMGGTTMHPQPETALAQPRQSFQEGGVVLPPGVIPIGSGSSASYSEGWQPGTLLNSQAGISEALFGEESAGSKSPYTGIDVDQGAAIGGGEWLPPQPATGFPVSPQPDYQNLQNSPQFGSAEASLAGAFGGTQASMGTAPAANSGPMPVGGARMPGPMGAAGATEGGLSRGGLGQIVDEYFGTQGSGGAGGAGGSGGFGYTPGSTPVQNPKTAPAAAAAPAAQQPQGGYWTSVGGTTTGGAAGGENAGMGAPTGNVFHNEWVPAGMSRAGGGGVNMRSGFQRGGFPQFTTYQPTANPARNPPTYTALDLSHLFGGGQQQQTPRAIQMQRQLGQARAKAAVQRGVVRPRVIAPDPVTGEHHDITPYRPEDDPRPQPPGPGGLPMTAPRSVAPVGGQAPATLRDSLTMREPSVPGSRGPGMGYPTLGLVPPEAAGTPSNAPMTRAAFFGGVPKQNLPATRAPPLEGTQEWNKPSAEVEAPRESAEFSEAGGRPLMAPRLVGGDPFGQRPLAIAPPSGDEAPMHTGWDVDLPGVFRGGGQGIAAEARGGRVPRYWGGRIGRDDGGSIPIGGGAGNVMEAPTGTPASPDLSNIDWDSIFGGNGGGVGTPDFSSLPDDTFDLGPSRGPQRAQIDPRAVAEAPSFQGAGGGGGGPHFTQVSNMGGPPISALDLSGHYTPTTGNARGATYVPGSGGGGAGAGISPNARAQAPEHPAITTMRHIVRQHDAMRARGSGSSLGTGIVDPEIVARQNMAGPGPMDPSIIANQKRMHPATSVASGITGDDSLSRAYAGFQGGGGVLGSSPMMNAGAYTPQGAGVTGQTSQGGGLGSIATANKAAGGFGDLFGGGDRAGFASGGASGGLTGADIGDPFLAEITASATPMQGGGGHGPPAPPSSAPPPAAGGGPLGGDGLGKLGDAVKKFAGQAGGQQTAPAGDPSDASGGWGSMAGTPDFSNLSDNAFDVGQDLGFRTGGGVGLGSLRGGFSDGGTPNLDAIDAEVAGGGPPAPPVAAPAPSGGGAAPAVPDLIKQNFGNRAGYASTISSLESGMGKSYVGDGGSSFGPFQLHMGGINPDMPHSGLGDEFKKQTGLDPRDPKTVPDQVKFVADYTAQHGWHDWSTKGQADKIAGGANVPGQDVQPAEADTSSYGGGFMLPGPSQSGPPPGQLDRRNLQAPTMGDELRHDPGGYLMSVGAAMMSSRAPQLGTAIGEGLTAGNNYLQAQKGLEKQWGEAQAQINNLSQEAREHGADADLKVQQLQIGAMMNKVYIQMLRSKGLLGGGSGGTAAPAPTGGQGAPSGGLPTLPTLGGGAAPSGAPSGAAAPSGGAPSGAAPAGAAPAGAAPAGGVPDLNQDPAYKAGTNLIAQGNQQNLIHPGLGDDLITQGKAQQEAAKSNWEKQAEISSKGQEAVTSATTEAQKPVLQSYLENREKFESTYDQTRSEISELSNIYQHFQAGRSSEAQAELASWANAFGFKLPQAASADAAMKSAIQQAFAAVANSGLQKAPRAGLREATMMVASPTRDPAALRKILTDQLATLDYQHDMYSNVPGHNLNVGDDMDTFTKAHKYGDYLGKARKEVPIFKGITPETMKNVTGEDWPAPLPKTGAQPGERYSLPNGKIVRAQPDGTFQVEYEP
jgi:hypothetical protein